MGAGARPLTPVKPPPPRPAYSARMAPPPARVLIVQGHPEPGDVRLDPLPAVDHHRAIGKKVAAPRTDNARLPPLLLQPLVENAVKHGVEPSDRGGKLRVLTELRGSRVVVRITNTLPPKEGKNGHGNGEDTAPRGHGIALANVRARLALLHDVQGEFTAGVQDGLYQVRITLPAPDPQPRARGRRSTEPPARRSSGNPGNRHGSRAAPLQRRMVDSPNDNNSPSRDHEHPDR